MSMDGLTQPRIIGGGAEMSRLGELGEGAYRDEGVSRFEGYSVTLEGKDALSDLELAVSWTESLGHGASRRQLPRQDKTTPVATRQGRGNSPTPPASQLLFFSQVIKKKR